jgi:23S rRNA (cytidine1920-2'-O)/16S rRNA (cytidine1409-2'-O)-methyltransferase
VPYGTVLHLNAVDPGHASRGAIKLAHGLDQFNIAVDGRIALDLGASTGGFCDILLRRGAHLVYAVDVGHGQLIDRLSADQRVIDLQGTDARQLTPAIIAHKVGIITADLAFISLTKALSPALGLADPGADLIALVKPQFEAGRDAIGKGGIVRDPADRARALDQVVAFLNAQTGWSVQATAESPITGGDGNQEYLVHARYT